MPKRTYQPSKKKRSKFGFLSRMKNAKGKKGASVIKRRRAKGRHALTSLKQHCKNGSVKRKRISRNR